jgi:hypothetical protein
VLDAAYAADSGEHNSNINHAAGYFPWAGWIDTPSEKQGKAILSPLVLSALTKPTPELGISEG